MRFTGLGFLRMLSFAVAAGLVQAAPAAERAASMSDLPNGPLIMGYYETWSEWPVSSGKATRLAALPGYIDLVAIGFARPDMFYLQPGDLRGTGLQVPFDGTVLAEAIATLKARNPRVRVVLSVGGSGYAGGWDGYAPDDLARLVGDLGLDGVDLDYEPADPDCALRRGDKGERVICRSDRRWADLIRQTRAVLPRPYLLTVPGWSVGAYGETGFKNEPPASRYTGSMLWLDRLPIAGDIDVVTIMGYAAGPAFRPQRAFAAYRAIWPGRLLLGMIVPPTLPGDPNYPASSLTALAREVAKDPLAGMMLYTLERGPPEGGSLEVPDAALAARSICEGLGRPACSAGLP